MSGGCASRIALRHSELILASPFKHSDAMGLPADMRGQKEWAVPQRQFGMPGKKA